MPKFIDFSGKKIGRVHVLNQIKEKSKGCSYWNCKCDCGNDFTCWSANFKRGDKFECKNCIHERRRGIDLTGRKFGRWEVLKREIDINNKTVWHCKCDCGNEGRVATSSLGKKSRSMSCGCLGRKMKSKHINTTLYPPAHGLANSKFYHTKTSLIHKCYNTKHPSYHKFGGKNITVCDLWRNAAKDMHEWAVQNSWQEGDVFCLKENEKEFNPLTVYIIKENEFRSQIALQGGFQITYNGETHSVLNWSKILDVNPGQLRRKLLNNPSVEEVFSSPFKKMIFVKNPEVLEEALNLYIQGSTQSEIAKIFKVSNSTLYYHLLKRGIPLREDDKKQDRRKDVKNEDILRLKKEGMSINKIAQTLGCTFPCIKYRLDKMEQKKRDRSKG